MLKGVGYSFGRHGQYIGYRGYGRHVGYNGYGGYGYNPLYPLLNYYMY
jgi:hypothetical protein